MTRPPNMANGLAMPQLTLEERVDRLESIEAIKRLKAVYCLYCDAKYDAEGICSLFTEDGVWDGGPSFGRYEGHHQIRSSSKEYPATFFSPRTLCSIPS